MGTSQDPPEQDAPPGSDASEPDPESDRARKWVGDAGGMSIVFDESQCHACIHKNQGSGTCTAFPDGIPLVIFKNEHDHRFPWPGDDGVTFDQDPDSETFDHETDLLTREELKEQKTDEEGGGEKG